MADPTGEPVQVSEPSLMEKIVDKIHDQDSSSSDSDDDKLVSHASAVKSKIYRPFGREKPVHKVLGGGKSADILLWRNKRMSATVVGGATAIWVLFEMLEYHFITLICHILILSLAVLFLWSNASTFINKSAPQVPEVRLPDQCVLEVVSIVRTEMNQALVVLRDIASGRDLKKFLTVIVGLWFISVIGSWFNFLTLFYLTFILLHILPVFYEKYEDQVDPYAEKALIEFKKHYAVFDEKVLSKIPKGSLKDKKHL